MVREKEREKEKARERWMSAPKKNRQIKRRMDGRVEGASNAVFGWSTLFCFSRVSLTSSRTLTDRRRWEMGLGVNAVAAFVLYICVCVCVGSQAIHLL